MLHSASFVQARPILSHSSFESFPDLSVVLAMHASVESILFVCHSYPVIADKGVTVRVSALCNGSDRIVNRSFLNGIAVAVVAEIIGQIAALSLAVFSRLAAAEIIVVIRRNAAQSINVFCYQAFLVVDKSGEHTIFVFHLNDAIVSIVAVFDIVAVGISCPCQQAACGVGVGGQRCIANFSRDQLSEHVVVEIILEAVMLNRGNRACAVIRIQILRSAVLELRHIVKGKRIRLCEGGSPPD